MGISRRLTRRSLLFGAGGLAMALPALEAMGAPSAGAPVRRYFIGFGGTSLTYPHHDYDLLVPDALGPGYDIKRALQPIADLGIRDSVSVVSGMEIPWGDPGSVPPGGRIRTWHAKSVAPLISGVRGPDAGEAAQGPTSDEIAADAIGSETTLRALNYRVQAAYYRGTNGDGGDRGRITYRDNGGSIVPVDPIVSPRLAYESLFTGFVPTDPAEAEAALAVLRRRRSAVDVVLESARSLVKELGAVDRQRMERHFDELRALEERLNQVSPLDGGACELPDAPGEDPPIGTTVDEAGDSDAYAAGGAYSGEEERAEILTDLVAMAFTCDLTRVASMMYTMSMCFMNAFPLTGAPADMHGCGHGVAGGGTTGLHAVSDVVAWHVRHFGNLVLKLRDTPDIGGESLLDNTALVLLFEGGWGYDPASGDQLSVHSSENMSALIAGHAGGLNPRGGEHVSHAGGHPTQVINTALRAVGVDHEMGEVAGVVDELLG